MPEEDGTSSRTVKLPVPTRDRGDRPGSKGSSSGADRAGSKNSNSSNSDVRRGGSKERRASADGGTTVAKADRDRRDQRRASDGARASSDRSLMADTMRGGSKGSTNGVVPLPPPSPSRGSKESTSSQPQRAAELLLANNSHSRRRDSGSKPRVDTSGNSLKPELLPSSAVSSPAGSRASSKASSGHGRESGTKATLDAFRRFDADGDGHITREELAAVLKELEPTVWTDRTIDSLLNAVDTNRDGRIDYEEFVEWCMGGDSTWDEARRACFKGGEVFSDAYLVVESKAPFEENFKVSKVLGEGAYGTVNLCVHKATNARRAVKTIMTSSSKSGNSLKVIEREIGVMKEMDHPNIVKLYEIYKDKQSFKLIMEVCSGGELFDCIVDEGSSGFSERDAANLMRQMFGGITYMHRANFCHRDIKPENFLLREKAPISKCIIKICDFGLATKFRQDKPLRTKAGTPYYVAPEVLKGNYNEACDMWSLAVIMYILLCGYPPFDGNGDDTLTLKLVRKGEYSFDDAEWGKISNDAKDLIRKLLVPQPQRMSAEEALNHVWIEKRAPQASATTMQEKILKNMKTFCGNNKLKKAALHIIANRLDEPQIKELQDTFASLDVNKDGVVTLLELQNGIEKLGIDVGSLQDFMDEMDTDGNGYIEYTEFLAASLDKKHYAEEKVCWAAFQVFDRDNSGEITREELVKVLDDSTVAMVMGSNATERVMQECDKDNDGTISFEEFMKMMRR
mmetsp:Transcript_890/g.2052  ORF Transcript_890/g.2052 Transcript_890/m.2052 type:complete len:739 (+) Transcript_890:87-2303(+)